MKKIIFVLLSFIVITGGGYAEDIYEDFSKDYIYGEELISSITKNVSLELEKANLVDVLKMFSQYTGLNFVSTEAVADRTLTLYMEDVPIKEAINIIFKANNLAYDYYPQAKIFVVKEMGKPSIELTTKVYRFKYARVSNSQFQDEVKSLTGGVSKFAVREAVERVLSQYGKVIEDPVSNSLIVTDIPVQFPTIDKVVAQLDVAQQKVLIEVEMLDVSKTVVDELGVTFGGNTGGFQADFNLFTKVIGSNPAGSYRFNNPPSPWREGLTTLTFNPLYKAILTDTTTKILARPKILTLSGETAEIGIVSDTVVGTTSEKSEEQGTTISINAERAETGVSLRVTPLVNTGTDEITIVLRPTVKETSTSSFSDENANEFYNIEETSTKSVVRLTDGQTLLIGGLIKNKNISVKEEIPFLAKIPLFGALFRGIDKQDEERELLVFLTPHIVRDEPVLVPKGEFPYREQKDSLKQESVESALDMFSK